MVTISEKQLSIYSSPISQFSSCRVSSPRVVYEDVGSRRNQRQSSRGLISEDFTALRDPFASPTRVGPSPKSPEPYSPVTPPATPQALRTSIVVPLPTPPQRTHSPPRHKKARVKTSSSHHVPSSCRFTNSSVGKKISSQSLQPLQVADDAKEVQEENKPNEDSFFLNDEALLSQILLHTLTMEAASPTSVPRAIHHSNSLSSYQESSLSDGKRLSTAAASRIRKNNSSMQTICTNDTTSERTPSRKRHSRSRYKTQYSTECLGMRRNTSGSASAFRSSGTDSGSVVTDILPRGKKQHETAAIPSEERGSCWWDEP
ncbi:hypothetical protein Clacol_000445 [Clathrus columnatus]|uniref:Uncharacterized protein n=1 Tax=Clathrus columnatus TaxID=1419009 RepID=A0AAV4ZWL4_9AGAM|nr:hypothetical protein Clacol_000445 [Clathrus columnatus]